jgi:hypothetical protein
MAHFAKLNNENIVEQVLVVHNAVLLKADGTESELKGKQFLNATFGNAKWLQTSYSGSIRKNYAGIGFTYDLERDAFISPKSFNSWLLNEENCRWEAPVPYPTDDKMYSWSEEELNWIELN